jgi:hypothetical protein
MKVILEEAARIGCAQMRVQSFADRRPARIIWPGRHWEWATTIRERRLERSDSLDVDAREKWAVRLGQ